MSRTIEATGCKFYQLLFIYSIWQWPGGEHMSVARSGTKNFSMMEAVLLFCLQNGDVRELVKFIFQAKYYT